MGFYAPAQLVADARKHGVEVLPVDVNHSDWDCTLETDQRCLRLGMRMISGFRSTVAEKIMEMRQAGAFESVSEFTQRTGFGQAVIAQLSRADAFGSLNQDRRSALWQALGQEKKPKEQPLFEQLEARDDETFALPQLGLDDQVAADYQTIGLSLKAHPMSFQREMLNELRVTACRELGETQDNRHLRVAGLVIVRQRPATANGITFVTLEDETGNANLIVKRPIWQRYFRVASQSSAWIAHGKLERKKGVTHVIVNRLEDMSSRLSELKIQSRNFR